MAYENIDVNSLRNSLNSCKDTINHNVSDDLTSSILNDNVWLCNSRKNLNNALYILKDIYQELRNDINRFLEITNQIESYKILQQEVVNLKTQHSELSGRLYYEEEYDDWYYNNETQTWESSTETRTVKDTNVENQMNTISNQIAEKESSMESLKSSINSSI